MSRVSDQQIAISVAAASCLLLLGATFGHALLGAVCAMTAFLGLNIRSRPSQRVLGNVLALSGALGFCIGLLFTTGYSLGKDMVKRDASVSSISIHVPTNEA